MTPDYALLIALAGSIALIYAVASSLKLRSAASVFCLVPVYAAFTYGTALAVQEAAFIGAIGALVGAGLGKFIDSMR